MDLGPPRARVITSLFIHVNVSRGQYLVIVASAVESTVFSKQLSVFFS